MDVDESPQIEERIARCRLILSIVAIAAVFADPTEPLVSSRIPIASGRFTIDPYVLIVMGTHLIYSSVAYLAASRGWWPRRFLVAGTTGADVMLGAAIALMTEGATSPFYAFFAFAVIVTGFRSGLHQTMLVTGVSVVLYLCMIVISSSENLNEYIMRPAYLAIVGYLVGYLGQQRTELQMEIRHLEAAEQRHRIARDLHDGFAQALAGINLRIEGCRRLLRRNDADDALSELTALQESVHREYDELRSYMLTLSGIRASPMPAVSQRSVRFSLCVTLDGSLDLVDHVLQIAREGIHNIRRHATATSADIRITGDDAQIRILIDDDGVGLDGQAAPWSILSRVKQLDGRIEVLVDGRRGAHLEIVLPRC